MVKLLLHVRKKIHCDVTYKIQVFSIEIDVLKAVIINSIEKSIKNDEKSGKPVEPTVVFKPRSTVGFDKETTTWKSILIQSIFNLTPF